MTNQKPKGTSALGAWILILCILAIIVSAFRSTWLAGRRSLIDDLGMDGFRVTIDAAIESGEGRCGVQVWRKGGWTDVAR